MKKNKGITLIALIITIIVMLILVAVSVNILIKSNLIGTAEKAVNKYKTATEDEVNTGTITINGKKYDSIDDYMDKDNLKLKYKEGEGKIFLYPKNSLWDYVENVPMKEKNAITKKYCGMTLDEYMTKLQENSGLSEEEFKEYAIGMYGSYEMVLNENFAMILDGTDELEEVKKTAYMKKVTLTLPDNTEGKMNNSGLFFYMATENGEYKFKAKSEDGQTDEVVVTVNYPEKNIKIQLVEKEKASEVNALETEEEKVAYLKNLTETETKQYTITTPRWFNLAHDVESMGKATMQDGASFDEDDDQVLYKTGSNNYLLYYIDENDKIVVVKSYDKIQNEHTYFGIYFLRMM